MLGARLKSWMEAQLGRAKKRKQKQTRQTAAATTGPLPPPHLSSPESAYSTGYSTDGTSPGTAPAPLAAPLVAPPPPPAPPTTHLYHEPAKVNLSVAHYFMLTKFKIPQGVRVERFSNTKNRLVGLVTILRLVYMYCFLLLGTCCLTS